MHVHTNINRYMFYSCTLLASWLVADRSSFYPFYFLASGREQVPIVFLFFLFSFLAIPEIIFSLKSHCTCTCSFLIFARTYIQYMVHLAISHVAGARSILAHPNRASARFTPTHSCLRQEEQITPKTAASILFNGHLFSCRVCAAAFSPCTDSSTAESTESTPASTSPHLPIFLFYFRFSLWRAEPTCQDKVVSNLWLKSRPRLIQKWPIQLV